MSNNSENIEKLRLKLQRHEAAGEIKGQLQPIIVRLLKLAWEEFAGSDESAMDSGKLGGLVENLRWNSPVLSFQIERHGRTVNDSKRADLHKWRVDLQQEKHGTSPLVTGSSFRTSREWMLDVKSPGQPSKLDGRSVV